MPFHEDVERHLGSVLEGERKYGQEKLAVQEERSACARNAADAELAEARRSAEEMVRAAEEEAAEAVRRAMLRLEREREAAMAEHWQAEERAAQAAAASQQRAEAAQRARDAARPEVETRVQRALSARDAAVADGEAAAAEAERLGEQRMAEARRREAQTDERARKQQEDAEAREARYLSDLSDRATELVAEARHRSELVQQSTAEAVELCSVRVGHWLRFVQDEKAATDRRIALETKKADVQASSEHGLTAELGLRSQQRLDEADGRKAGAAEKVARACNASEKRHLQELELLGEEVEAFRGLSDLAVRLRSGELWRGGGNAVIKP